MPHRAFVIPAGLVALLALSLTTSPASAFTVGTGGQGGSATAPSPSSAPKPSPKPSSKPSPKPSSKPSPKPSHSPAPGDAPPPDKDTPWAGHCPNPSDVTRGLLPPHVVPPASAPVGGWACGDATPAPVPAAPTMPGSYQVLVQATIGDGTVVTDAKAAFIVFDPLLASAVDTSLAPVIGSEQGTGGLSGLTYSFGIFFTPGNDFTWHWDTAGTTTVGGDVVAHTYQHVSGTNTAQIDGGGPADGVQIYATQTVGITCMALVSDNTQNTVVLPWTSIPCSPPVTSFTRTYRAATAQLIEQVEPVLVHQ